MYTEMPEPMRNRITSLLNTNNFTAAKALYDLWHMKQMVKSACNGSSQSKSSVKQTESVQYS